MEEIYKKADELQEARKLQECLDYLKQQNDEHPNDVEIMWRLARAYYEVGDEKPDDKEFRKTHLTKGLEVITKALELNDKHWAPHKWLAIFISAMGDYVPTKEKVQNAYKIKEHALKALEIRGNDPTTLYLLGRWCFAVASIGWIERTVASTLFASPPESSFEEALSYFQKAAEIDPNHIRNALCLADTYAKLKQKDKAREWYQRVVDLPVRTQNERMINEEAAKKLKAL